MIGSLVLDLLESARLRGLPQYGLETITEQLGIIDSFSEANQVSLLRVAIAEYPRLDTNIERLVDLYLARDLAGVMEIWNGEMLKLDPLLAALFERRYLIDRNLTMVERMEARLIEGGTFVAVGAMHLPRSNGILALLAQRGFRVSRVY